MSWGASDLGALGSGQGAQCAWAEAIDAAQQEPEAESVAFLVCARNGVASKSEKYIANHVTKNTTIDHIRPPTKSCGQRDKWRHFWALIGPQKIRPAKIGPRSSN